MPISKLIRYQDNSYITSQGTLLEGFETFADWTITGTGATGSGDSTHRKQGLQSLRLNSVNGVACSATKVISEDLSTVTNFIVWVYVVDDVPMYNFSEFGLYISSTTDFSKFFYLSIYANEDAWAGHYKQGWNRLVIRKGAFSNSGAESWSNTMIRLRIRCGAATGKNASISVDDLRYDHVAEAKCILSFDGGYDSLYNYAKSVLDSNGQVGMSNVVAGSIGSAQYMTKAQLTTLQDAGWDISQYSYTGSPHLTEISQVAMEEEIDNAYAWLVNNGFSKGARFFAIPHGEYNQAVLTKIKERHKIARSIILPHYQPHFNLLDDDIGFLVKAEIMHAVDAPATVEGWIDNTITQGGLLVLLFHQIVESGASGSDYDQADLEAVSDYLASSGIAAGIDVITFSDYYDQFIPSDLTSVVYLEHGPLVPCPIAYKQHESIGRADDGKLKVYSHPLAGDRKRIFRIKCIIDDSGSSGYKWRDLEYFYTKVVEGAKRQCVFVDANSVQYLVRIIDFAPRAIGLNNQHEVTMILEEDYA